MATNAVVVDRVHREVVVPLAWHWVSKVREEVAKVLAMQTGDLLDAAIMAGSELAENVVKYGEPTLGHESGNLIVDLSRGRLSITSSNGVSSPSRAQYVFTHIARIRATLDLQSLYVERMRQMLESPCEATTGLGLIRIAYEGRFLLSSQYDRGILTVVAERELA